MAQPLAAVNSPDLLGVAREPGYSPEEEHRADLQTRVLALAEKGGFLTPFARKCMTPRQFGETVRRACHAKYGDERI